MTPGSQGSEEKGYFCQIGESAERMLTTPLRARQPATGNTVGGCLVPVAQVQFGENTLHVILDRVLADHQTLGDLGVGETGRRQLQHLQLSNSQLFFRSEGLCLAAY